MSHAQETERINTLSNNVPCHVLAARKAEETLAAVNKIITLMEAERASTVQETIQGVRSVLEEHTMERVSLTPTGVRYMLESALRQPLAELKG